MNLEWKHSQSNDPSLNSAGQTRSESELLERISELLKHLNSEGSGTDVGWELGLHVNSLSEAVKEMSVRIDALEQENHALHDRLGNERLEYSQLRESMDELLNLNELSEAISTSFNIEDILQALIDLAGRVMEYDSCGVFALSTDGSELTSLLIRGVGGDEKPSSVVDEGEHSPFEDRIQAQWSDGIIDWVLREGRPVVIDDMESVHAKNHRGARSFVIIPLMVGGKKIGVFTLYCRKVKDDFTLGEIELLGVLANQTAVAIENSRLYTDLEISHDQLKESQRQLLMSAKQAAIGELAGGVAHEVNNPLQIILSRVQLMIAQGGDRDEKVVAGLKLIEANVQRISKIIRALLGFASHNTANAEWDSYHLNQAIHQACALVRHQLEGQLIAVEINVPEDLPPLTGNVGELEQVFINLMLNAQNAMPSGGTLRIDATLNENEVAVRFADTGEGIRPEHVDRISEPFFTTRASEGGTGLGLAVSYRIVDNHKGSITVDSEFGEGATFILKLPVKTAGKEADGVRGEEEEIDIISDSEKTSSS